MARHASWAVARRRSVTRQPGKAASAFTLIELLIVIAVIGLLVAILLPAIQAARSSSRRTQCVSNVRQLCIALNNYESARGHLPSGAMSRPYAADSRTPHNFFRWSALAQLTPYLEQSTAYGALDLSLPLYGRNYQVPEPNRPGVALLVPEFLCPEDLNRRVNPAFGPTNYAVCTGTGLNGGSPFDTDGVFFINSNLSTKKVKDGLSKTVAFSESILGREVDRLTSRGDADPRFVYAFARAAPLTEAFCRESAFWNYTDPRGFAWVSGEYRCGLYNHYWLPNSPEFDCLAARTTGPLSVLYTAYGWRTARSLHPGGVNVAMIDGSVRFIEDSISQELWRALATRAQGDRTDQ